MSIQSDAKAKQGYRRDLDKCVDCKHFTLDVVMFQPSWGGKPYPKEKNLRCGIGGFKVHKMAVCNRFDRKPEEFDEIAA